MFVPTDDDEDDGTDGLCSLVAVLACLDAAGFCWAESLSATARRIGLQRGQPASPALIWHWLTARRTSSSPRWLPLLAAPGSPGPLRAPLCSFAQRKDKRLFVALDTEHVEKVEHALVVAMEDVGENPDEIPVVSLALVGVVLFSDGHFSWQPCDTAHSPPPTTKSLRTVIAVYGSSGDRLCCSAGELAAAAPLVAAAGAKVPRRVGCGRQNRAGQRAALQQALQQ